MIEESHAAWTNNEDRHLKAAVMAKLLSGTGTPPGIVTAEVENGCISLSIEIDYRFQQKAVAF